MTEGAAEGNGLRGRFHLEEKPRQGDGARLSVMKMRLVKRRRIIAPLAGCGKPPWCGIKPRSSRRGGVGRARQMQNPRRVGLLPAGV